MTENKKDNLYYCFRYKCKRCPRQVECEKEMKRGDTIERRTKHKTRRVLPKVR